MVATETLTMEKHRWGAGPAYGAMVPEDRTAVFALECPQAVEWRNWRPGNEYEKVFVIKNVGAKSCRIKYQLPASKYFSMEFPEPTKIGAGLTWSVKVTFRPVKLEEYDDQLTFLLANGSFSVPLLGRLPKLGIEVQPQEEGFGYVAVKESADRTVVVTNTGDAGVQCKWRLEEPFSVKPSRGHIPQGGSAEFTVTFAPAEASVFSAQAVCMVEDSPGATLNLHGIGKFPHISVDLPAVNFGELHTGLHMTRHCILSNPSLVPANFQVRNVDSTGPAPVTRVSPSSGCIPPGEQVNLELTYSPVCTGTASLDAFEISTPGGNKVKLTMTGTALGPVVTPSATCVNFGSLEAGSQAVRSLSLTNETDQPARFEFVNDPLGVFSFGDAVRGVIPPLLTVSVTLAFSPSAPSHHWKRVTCLVKNGEPFFVDLIGTGFTDKLRPPVLSPHHLEDYLARVAAGGNPLQMEGGGGSSPTERSRAQSRAASRAQSRAQSAAPSEMVREVQSRAGVSARSSWEQLFLGYDAFSPLVASVDSVEFGACSRLRPADYKSVTLKNNTTAKITLYPTAPRWQDPLAPPDTPPAEPVFKVFPETADIRPGESATFRIGFRPPHDGQYYSGIVDFVAHVKHMRSFRTAAEQNFNAPFNVPVTVLGNTFLHVPEEMLPKFELSASTVQFPPTRAGEAVHQTVELMNKGDTTVLFDFQDKAVSDAFQVKPRCGRILPHSSVLVALRFCPAAAQQYTRQLHVSVNHGLKAAKPLKLMGAGYKPSLHFDVPGGTCFFKPTCVGAGSTRPLVLRNPSSIPVVFSWSIPRSLKPILQLSPAAGQVPGKGELTLQATFRPEKIKTYTGQLMCNIIAAHGEAALNAVNDALVGIEADPGIFDDCQPLSVVAEGSNGAVSIEPPSLDLGVVLAGDKAEQQLTLLNHSPGVLRYRMEVVEEGTRARSPLPRSPKHGPFNPEGNITSDSPDVSVDEPEGILYARTPKTITLLMHPKARGSHRYQVLLHTAAGEGGALPSLGSPNRPPAPSATADVSIDAKFPELQVTDVFSMNSPKLHLWQNLGIQALNTELASVVGPVEIEILKELAEGGEVPTKTILRRLEPMDVRFGAGAQGSEPTVVHFELQNTGDVLPIVWSLSSDDSAGVELENWVEHGYPLNKADRDLHFIEEHKIFDIVPKSGTLPPRGTCRLTIAYKHIAPGLHELPLLLQIAQGKKLHVKLHGVTVSPQTQALSWPLEQHTLLPVPIGDPEAPLQVVPLRNGGPSAVKYQLDTSALDAVTADNRNVEVLRLASPAKGVIPPGRTALLNFVLQPVEAKEVVVDVPIKFSNGKGTTLSLMGRGYHPEVPRSEQEQLEGEALLDLSSWKSFSPEPHLQIPETLGVLSTEVISLGSMPINAIQRRAVVVTNTWDLPVRFTWDLDQMRGSVGCIDGVLEVQPPSGELDVGDSAICKLVYKSGLKTQVLQGEIRCWVEPTDEALEANEQIIPGATMMGAEDAQQATMWNNGAPVPGPDGEEVIEVHPPLEGGTQTRTRPPASRRLPLHVAMTQTVTNQKEPLNVIATETSRQVQDYMVQMSAPREAPVGHDLLLYIHGRVLADHQLKDAVCCVPSEREGAQDAHTETGWRVPTVEPLVKEPPPGLFPQPKAGHQDRGQPWQSADPEMGTAVSILTDLILEAVASPELAAAVAELEEEGVPRFAQVNAAAGRLIDEAGNTEPAEPVVQEPPVRLTPLPPPPTSVVIPGEHEDLGAGDEEAHQEPEAAAPAVVAEGNGPLVGDEEEEEEEGPHVREMVGKPEVQVFMEFVLESAIFGLIQESVVDDWDPLDQQEDEDEEEERHAYEDPSP